MSKLRCVVFAWRLGFLRWLGYQLISNLLHSEDIWSRMRFGLLNMRDYVGLCAGVTIGGRIFAYAWTLSFVL